MLSATLLVAGLAVSLGGLLIWLDGPLRGTARDPSDAIVELLPRIQCGQCGYPGCRPYAEAITSDEADINQCPPGGEAGIRALADLLGREPKPLNPENGEEQPATVAVIDEQACIGCTLCIQACPVDAIVGAAKLMHTVIEQECTGCDLCLPPCPVDCIAMVISDQDGTLWAWPEPGRPAAGGVQ